MRRKARGMEKVENLYCTARAQHVMPRRSDHVAGSSRADRFKPARPGGGVRARPDCGRSESRPDILTLNPHWPREGWATPSDTAGWRSAMPGGLPRRPCRDRGPGAVSRSRHRVPAGTSALQPVVRYESIRPTELCEYCADIAPIAPSLRGVPQSLTGIRPSFLRCSAPRL